MKSIIANATILGAGLLVSVVASADCTRDPFRLGWDSADLACNDIARGWIPGPSARGERGEGPTPETVCTTNDIVRCKQAMAQYLRDPRGSGCASLIRRNVRLRSPFSETETETASQVWARWVDLSCNPS